MAEFLVTYFNFDGPSVKDTFVSNTVILGDTEKNIRKAISETASWKNCIILSIYNLDEVSKKMQEDYSYDAPYECLQYWAGDEFRKDDYDKRERYDAPQHPPDDEEDYEDGDEWKKLQT